MGKHRAMKTILMWMFVSVLLLGGMPSISYAEGESMTVTLHGKKQVKLATLELPKQMKRFSYDSGLSFNYPDAVRGVYLTGHTAGGYQTYIDYVNGERDSLTTPGRKFGEIVERTEQTDLNAMVIDIKDDWGNLTYIPDEDSPFYKYGKPYIREPRKLLEYLEEKEIYPIARIVVFKDSVWPKERPELSFKQDGQVWTNRRGESFVNPFLKEVWDHNVQIAIEAAKLGFKEIQFDYVRFPEGFEHRDDTLEYGMGEYENIEMDNVQKRVKAVTDFVAYAKEQLEYYDVDVAVDIFGYTATLPEAPGIGQNFTKISQHVDVISSMIYPSHWTAYFGIAKPDLEPYRLVTEYAKVEKQKLAELENPPTSRPWIQDFTASYLGSGNYRTYGKEEVEAQIRALNEQGINEYLLWNAANNYTKNVDYTP
ncbi:putative glycoside hydrolase [Bacillus solimangrovi]|uniref:GTP-binding protein n=1 Tax=Bacillus solimangrovi TaxID=1305675 RepID=A0A1E5LBZ9_9BACI|nr:putative glycoside hydrolase [Bacillus solimangrovi]OEH91618.1 GTP-binding protein [Bacillus solimangrovi]